MQLFPVIIGPTASGKSALAVEVARRLGGIGSAEPEPAATANPPRSDLRAEIITADAFQVYRGFDIGTAKPTVPERGGIVHHLIDVAEPGERFTVHDWLTAANACVDEVRSRAGLPIVVGGTHLYIKSFLEGMFEGPGADAAMRAELGTWPPSRLRSELERIDPSSASKLHPNDLRRTIRAIEVFRLTGTPISKLQTQWDAEDHRRKDVKLIVLDWPVEELNRRINARVKEMVERGLVDEARRIWERYRPLLRGGGRGEVAGDRVAAETCDVTGNLPPAPSWNEGVSGEVPRDISPQAFEALGYKQLFAHFAGRCSLEDAIEQIKIETRRFAKNQRTWMRRLRTFPGAIVIDASSVGIEEQVERVMSAVEGSA